MHSGTQSELPSMTFPQKNASTIFAMPDMGPPNQDIRAASCAPPAGAAGCFLPAYSPDLDPIEQVFDGFPNAGAFMGTEIVHQHDFAGRQGSVRASARHRQGTSRH